MLPGDAHLLPDYPFRQNGVQAPGRDKDICDAAHAQPPWLGFACRSDVRCQRLTNRTPDCRFAGALAESAIEWARRVAFLARTRLV